MIKCPVCGKEVVGENGLIAHMSKIHPGEYEKYKNKETKMPASDSLLTITKEIEEKTDKSRGFLAPPLSEEERKAKNLANLQLRMLEQWRLTRLLLEGDMLSKIVNMLADKVQFDEDIKQAISIEIYSLVIQPTIESFGLMRASNEAVYKEYENLGIKVEKPATPTLDAMLKEIQSRINVRTRREVRKEEEM